MISTLELNEPAEKPRIYHILIFSLEFLKCYDSSLICILNYRDTHDNNQV
ncbi:hypothetical protein MNBD_GAMMA07-2731 [hydrothermal vent metagenome]|uniref:Uncharacterized protein n=1 Tax=hydrothermal vent metagenome TaxID=652676 RepID=A0A3B0X0H2_9ZZZZ